MKYRCLVPPNKQPPIGFCAAKGGEAIYPRCTLLRFFHQTYSLLMEQTTISFSATDDGVVTRVTAADYIKGRKVVFRGISSSVLGLLEPDSIASATVKRFVLTPIWDYNTTPPVKGNDLKLSAVCQIADRTVKISLREDQTDIYIGQTVTIRAAAEIFEPSAGKKVLSAEIL